MRVINFIDGCYNLFKQSVGKVCFMNERLFKGGEKPAHLRSMISALSQSRKYMIYEG